MKRSSLLWAFFVGGPLIASAGEWNQWMEHKVSAPSPAVQARLIEKAGRFQLWGPAVGGSERRDLYTNLFGSLGGRYYFAEMHGWEFARAIFNSAMPAGIAGDIQTKTSYPIDVQPSGFSISTSYVFTPIYGKYAWGDENIVHFDLYGLAGVGLRFARDRQVFGELGLGMSHYLTPHFSVAPEIRLRLYQEKRVTDVFVSEVALQLGAAWLF